MKTTLSVALCLTLLAPSVAAQDSKGSRSKSACAENPAQGQTALVVQEGRSELPLDREAVQLRFPLIGPAKAPSTLPTVALVSVRHDGLLREDLRSAFGAPILTSECDGVLVDVTATKLLRFAGNYELVLQVSPSDGSELARSRLVLEVTVPKATLRPIEKLIVERTWFFFGQMTTEMAPFKLEEASGRLPLTDLSLRQARISTFQNDQVTGRLESVGAIADIPRGGYRMVAYGAEGEFPFGIVTGRVDVVSPQLGAPLSVPFEVRTRVASFYILPLVVFGLFLSWLVKVHLKNLIELGRARQDAAPVLERATRELEQRQDPGFEDARNALRALEDAMAGDAAENIVAAVKELESAIAAASGSFEERKAVVARRLDKLRSVVEPNWSLPRVVVEALHAPTDAIQEARECLRNGMLDAASTALDTAERDFVAELGAATRAWRTAVNESAFVLANANQGLSVSVQEGFKSAFRGASEGIESAAFLEPNATVDKVLEFLPALARSYQRAMDAFWQLGELLKLEVAGVESALAGLPLPDAASLKALVALTNDAAIQISGLAESPTVDLKERLRALHAAWVAGVGGQVDVVKVKGVRDQLEARNYREAALDVRDVLKPRAANVALGAGKHQWIEASAAPTRQAGATLLLVNGTNAASAEREPFVAIARESKKQVRVAKFWQSLIVGAIAGVIVYGGYQETFVGNPAQLMQILLWAFGADVTVDALLKLKVNA